MNKICTYLLLLLTGLSIHADQVVFKNGRTLDCTIIEVHPKHVEVSLGSGSMNIPKSQLSKLIRTKKSQPADTTTASKNILSARHTPPAHAKLAEDFREVMKKRNAAWDAQYMVNLHEKEMVQLNRRIEQLVEELKIRRDELNAVAQEQASIIIPENRPRSHREYRKYEALVKEKVALNDKGLKMSADMAPFEDELMAAAKKVEKLRKQINEDTRPLPGYFSAISDFEKKYDRYKASIDLGAQDDASNQLFAKIDRYMAQFKNETSTTVLDAWSEGNTTFVRAIINNKTSGIFILDTGASTMTLTLPFAKKAGIRIDHLPVQEARVADGSKVEAKYTVLRSVQVGDSSVPNVEVAILGENIGGNADGLLGMTFLRHFTIDINGSTGDVKLTKFSADRN